MKTTLLLSFLTLTLLQSSDSIRCSLHGWISSKKGKNVPYGLLDSCAKRYKAYILGKQDPMCSNIIEKVRGIVFLATPHRGAGDAKLLNLILEASPFSTSKKEYIAQLEPTSSMLQDINDQFSKMCSNLVLVSFYETMKTVFGWGIKRIVRL